MKVFFLLIALGVLFGCAKPPQMPNYETSYGKECALACEKDYSDCLASDVRPDFLILSPRKSACQKWLNGCYQLCLKKEKQ